MNERQLVWDLPVRVFHWSLAASFAGAYVLSESERWRNVHVMLGYTVLGLIAFRVVWGFVGTHYARFTSFRYWPSEAVAYLKEILTGRARHYTGHNPAGSWAVYALMALGLATGVSGYLNFNEVGGDAMEEAHEVMANLWLLVVALHVAGVVVSSLAHRENLVRSMVTGYKLGAGPGSAGSPAASVTGVAMVAAVLGFWTWSTQGGAGPVSTAEAAQEAESEHRIVADEESDDD